MISLLRSSLVPAMALAVSTASMDASADVLWIVDDLPGTFEDISKTGTALNLSGDLEALIQTTIGNVVFPAGRVVVGNNGGMGFDPESDDLAPFNEPIPSNGAFGGSQSALAFWDNIGNTIGDVYWQERGGTLIVQWHNQRFFGSEDTSRFQIKIFEDAPLGISIVAQFIYDDIEQPRPDGGASATIGYQNGLAGFNDFQWSFNTSGAVGNGTVLSIVIPGPGASVMLLGVILAGPRRRRRLIHAHIRAGGS